MSPASEHWFSDGLCTSSISTAQEYARIRSPRAHCQNPSLGVGPSTLGLKSLPSEPDSCSSLKLLPCITIQTPFWGLRGPKLISGCSALMNLQPQGPLPSPEQALHLPHSSLCKCPFVSSPGMFLCPLLFFPLLTRQAPFNLFILSINVGGYSWSPT